MAQPLVSVICLCYNHERFVQEAIESVMAQNHPAIQLIIADDASTDNSVKIIQHLMKQYPSIEFLHHDKNLGNCKSFNHGLSLAKGEFIIDLAADDILLPDRITEGLKAFQNLDSTYGVNFSDAEWIDEQGQHLYFHSERFPHDQVPQGDVYRELIHRYFICSPTMMFKRKVIENLGGYDESLAYEDFDFWIRSSRNFKYCYTPEVLVKKRVVKNSLGKKQFSRTGSQVESTFEVCKKIRTLNKTKKENKALRGRILYEMWQVSKVGKINLLLKYSTLLLSTVLH